MEDSCTFCSKHENSNISKSSSFFNDCSLHLITEKIYGLLCLYQNHQDQLQNAILSISKIKEHYSSAKIKLISITEVCPQVVKLFDQFEKIICHFKLPPILRNLIRYCEAIFDWLAQEDNNIIVIFSNQSMELLVLIVLCYSKFYDSLTKRDLRKSCAIKAFLNSNNKYLQNVPVSYRRYANYLSQYSMNLQLSSLNSAVHLFCIVLQNFPDMHSDPNHASDLFFKIYTDYPLKCCHTTNTYSLACNINRLVILFDQYPVSLHNDVMLVCYHKYPIMGREKLFRLNFHCCQVNEDILHFLRSDVEDVYESCPLKMKINLYFKETAILQDETLKSSVQSKNDLEPIQKFDSYIDFRKFNFEKDCVISNCLPKLDEVDIKSNKEYNEDQSIYHNNNQVSITLMKTSIDENSSANFISRTGQITGPVDIQHSSKVDKIRTSTTDMNTYNLHNNNNNLSNDKLNSNVIKCNQQLDNLMQDINSNHRYRTSVNGVKDRQTNDSVLNNRFHSLSNINRQNSTTSTNANNPSQNNREIQLMNELLEAQREITNLRRSYNQLNTIENTNRFTTKVPAYNNVMKHRETYSTKPQSRIPPASPTNSLNNYHQSIRPSESPNRYFYESSSYHDTNSSATRPLATGGYSAHRENLELQKQQQQQRNLSSTSLNRNTNAASSLARHRDTTDVLEEVETINLQPIGKGIQDLTLSGRNSRAATPQLLINNNSLHPQQHQQQQQQIHHHDNQSMVTNTLSPTLSRQNYNWMNNTTTPTVTAQHQLLTNHSSSTSSRQYNNTINNNSGSMRNTGPPKPLFVNSSSAGASTIGPNSPNQFQVDDTIGFWYRPNITRDQAIQTLKFSSPGTFIIRDSNTYVGAYGLAVKVATIPSSITPRTDDIEAEKVRHYLIEQSPNSTGVRFKGFAEEPSFPNLNALVLYYCRNQSVLPCLLSLPLNAAPLVESRASPALRVSPNNTVFQSIPSPSTTHSKSITVSSNTAQNSIQPKLGYAVYYLGCYDVEFITGPSVINKAIEHLLNDLDSRRFTECQLLINSAGSVAGGGESANGGGALILTDMERKLFFRRHHPFSSISYCGLDPKDRKVELELCKSRGIKKTKVFGLIIKNYTADENKCFLFGELDPHYKSSMIVQEINNNIQQTLPQSK